jgi:hypothetical protein
MNSSSVMGGNSFVSGPPLWKRRITTNAIDNDIAKITGKTPTTPPDQF